MPLVSEHNIARVSFLYAIIVVGVMTFSTGALFIIRKSENLKNELVEVEKSFIEEQKKQLKSDVNELILRVNNSRQWTQSQLEHNLAKKVEEAKNIAASLNAKFHEQLERQELENIIKEAIRPIRFNEKEGYCFIITESGQALLYPADPNLEGKNFYSEESDGDPEVTDTLITIARERGQGIYRYEWWKPGELKGVRRPKISYVTWFAPYKWVIGSGEYIDNLTVMAQTAVTSDLRYNLSTGTSDYYFIYKIHNMQGGKDFATILINKNRPDLVNKKISDDYKDARGKPFRKEFLDGIREDGEAYVVYWYKKPDGSGISRKLSYFKLYPEWNWVIARGVYFDRLDKIIASRKSALREKVKKDIQILLLFFLAAVSIALVVAYHFAGQLQNIFNRYRNDQQKHFEDLEKLNKTLEEQNRTDPLTNIYNRAYLTTKLEEEIKRSSRYSSPLSVIIFDIDHFKNVNDSYGHLAGDAILKELTALIGENIRGTDTFARWGGEEFIILAPGIDINQALQIAEKLRKKTENQAFSINTQITCSFGVSCCKPDEEHQAVLLRADDALYKAKQNGRNQSVAI